MIALVGLVGLLVGLALNPLITTMADDPKAANPQPQPRYRWLGYPTWLGALVAILMGAMAMVLYSHYGTDWRTAYWGAMTALLLVTAAVDYKARIIDVLTLLVGTVVALAAASFVGIGFKLALLGCIIAGGVFVLFYLLAIMMFPGPGVPFGLGDVYLAIYIGALVGIGHVGPALFYGMLMAGVVAIGMLAWRQMGKTEEVYLSYGTYLCLGVLLFLALYGASIR